MKKKEELDKVAAVIAKCRECKKKKSGFPVSGEGSVDARIMFIGEAPGREESKTGRPFIGRSGRLLTQLLDSVGIHRQDVYITSPVKYYPGKRAPATKEITHGKKHLKQQVDIIRPKVIVLMGNTAIKAMLKNTYQVTKMHGKFVYEEGHKYFITFHPAAALRFPKKYKKKLHADFKKLVHEV